MWSLEYTNGNVLCVTGQLFFWLPAFASAINKVYFLRRRVGLCRKMLTGEFLKCWSCGEGRQHELNWILKELR